MGDTFLTSMHLPSEDAVKADMERMKAAQARANEAASAAGKASERRGRRERANTFTGSRSGHGKDKGGSEGKRGWRTLVKMLSKPQLRSHGSNGQSGSPKGDPYALTRQPSRG